MAHLNINGETVELRDLQIVEEEGIAKLVRGLVCGSVDAQNLLMSNAAAAEGQSVQLMYRGADATVALSVATSYMRHFEGLIVGFLIKSIASGQVAADRWEFILLNVSYGISDLATTDPLDAKSSALCSFFEDRCEMQIDGITWTIRKLYRSDDELIPGDVAVQLKKERVSTPHSLLHVAASEISYSQAAERADDICWLLQLALAQRVTWHEGGSRTGVAYGMRQIRSVALPTEPSAANPLRNRRDGKIKRFLEAAYPIYKLREDWWRLTLNWYGVAHDNVAIEVAGVIYSILLDRISTERLKETELPRQFDPNLDETLGRKGHAKWVAVRDDVTAAVRRFSPSWTDERSDSLLTQIRQWNNTPSYPKKIALAFADLPVRPLKRELTDPRHVLLHEGDLELKGISPVQYYLHLNRFITAVLLTMLGYRGEFFATGLGSDQIPFSWTPAEAAYIQDRAYFIWLARAKHTPGDSLDDWLTAEREGVPMSVA